MTSLQAAGGPYCNWPTTSVKSCVCRLTAGCCCLVQLKDLTKEYETTAEGQAVKLKDLLERERALQAAATQLAAKRSQLHTSGQAAEVGDTRAVASSTVPSGCVFYDLSLLAAMSVARTALSLQNGAALRHADQHCLCRRM